MFAKGLGAVVGLEIFPQQCLFFMLLFGPLVWLLDTYTVFFGKRAYSHFSYEITVPNVSGMIFVNLTFWCYLSLVS